MQSGNDGELRDTRWLSCDLAELALDWRLYADDDRPASGFHVDVLIIGSGYGGAAALSELAGATLGGQTLKIAMLERGSEYLPGAFPTRMSDLAGCVRVHMASQPTAQGRMDGLFDLRIGSDVSCLLGNGLGGGSLINAGVMEPPLEAVFRDPRWPPEIQDDASLLMEQAAEMQQALGATPFVANTQRAAVMDSLGGTVPSRPVAVTVATSDEAARGISKCIGCGDCTVGCNHGAKLSLDVTLLASARRRHPDGALRIVTGASVLDLQRLEGGGYEASVWHTDSSLRSRQVREFRLRARRVILAAGTFGSTELLMRAKASGLAVSNVLGQRFSGNGDDIAAVQDLPQASGAVADEGVPFGRRDIGPTITRMVDARSDPRAPRVIQDLAVAGPLRRLLEETLAAVGTLSLLGRYDGSLHGRPGELDPAGIDPNRVDRSMLVAIMGHDDANGGLRLPADRPSPREGDGTLGVVWPQAASSQQLSARHAAFDAAVTGIDKAASGVANPVWRPLPDAIGDIVGTGSGGIVSVHPLGGCAMSDTAERGVVNAIGQVFAGTSGSSVHEDLVVLDGAMIPMSLGINPSLTIATLSRRSVGRLMPLWRIERVAAATGGSLGPRPIFRRVPPPEVQASTRIEMCEQMKGDGWIEFDGERRQCEIEVELRFRAEPVSSLTSAAGPRVLEVDPARSAFRIYLPAPAAAQGEEPQDGKSALRFGRRKLLVRAPLSGRMHVFERMPSGPIHRPLRAWWAWVLNRGLRDITQAIVEWFRTRRPKFGNVFARIAGAFALWWHRGLRENSQAIVEWFRTQRSRLGKVFAWFAGAFTLGSRAGTRRTIRYELDVGRPEICHAAGRAEDWHGARLSAMKTLTYKRAANPITQLMSAGVTEWPQACGFSVRNLVVDPTYFSSAGVPLARIASQADAPRALVDLASLALYVARVLLPLHTWTFRLPDAAEAPPASVRLPGDPGHGLPKSEPFSISMPDTSGSSALLTRYKSSGGDLQPVLLIHGYSASGTTFVHRSLPGGGLAGALCRAGFDVWVLDMRSSSGFETSRKPWVFEQMAYQDIPMAVDFIRRETGYKRLDVVAHCMGAAMLSIGLLADRPIGEEYDLVPVQRAAMRSGLRRIVFSQVAPAVVMSPANTARAYLFAWLRHYVKLDVYELRPAVRTFASDLLDRLLCAVPYPEEDFHRENPLWPLGKLAPWVATRHRMDALFGETFKLANMAPEVLNAIDEFFGPIHLKTTSQVIAFARECVVTDSEGNGSFVNPASLARLGDVRVLGLHSEKNGLADYRTRGHLLRLMSATGLAGSSTSLGPIGHQDSLIGRKAQDTYDHIIRFLGEA